jgi:hypothetical protein
MAQTQMLRAEVYARARPGALARSNHNGLISYLRIPNGKFYEL